MAFCTIGVSKQKGGSVGSSGRHNDRERETPNADPERTHLNRVLIGDERPVRERVDEIISEHGGKPRRDSVEAVELLLSASHEYFAAAGGEIDEGRLERWVGQAQKFLGDRSSCGICAKAVLHLDERTPHIHAHMVPITEDGRLSATHFLDGRRKMKELHTRYASYMEPLGLERGREGSRARHQRVQQFYASVTKEPELKIEADLIPDPSRLKLFTAEGARAYKLEVLAHVLEQIREPVRVLQDQARLTRDEHAHRVEAEKRAEEAGRQAEERVAEARREAEEQIAALRGEAAERFENLRRSALALYEENKELRREKDELRAQRDRYNEAFIKATLEKQEFQALARQRGDRLSDIPLTEVMTALDYHGERRGEEVLYRARDGRVSMTVTETEARNYEGRVICRNSLDLVLFMENVNKGGDVSLDEAFSWLADNFGEGRAAAAYVARSEQSAAGFLEERRLGRERQAPERSRPGHDDPGRGAPDPEPPGYSFDR